MVSRAGPVAVTGASGQVATALQRRLAQLPNEVRPLGRDDELARALADACAVVHLAGTLRPLRPNSYEAANLETVRRTVGALEGSAVERVVFLSYVGADPSSPNAYVRAKGQAEELLRNCGRDAVIFRCTHIYGPPGEPGPTASAMLSRDGRPVSLLGDGRQRLAPIYRDDLVEAIVRAALDPEAPVGTFALAGPEEMTLEEFVRLVNGGQVRTRHLSAVLARALSHVVPSLPPALVDVMLRDCLTAENAAEAFGVAPRRVSEVYGVGATAPAG